MNHIYIVHSRENVLGCYTAWSDRSLPFFQGNVLPQHLQGQVAKEAASRTENGSSIILQNIGKLH
jgi:hypothetical protein